MDVYLLQYSSRVFCLLPRTTVIKRRAAERGGHRLTIFSTQTCGTLRFTTTIFHPSSWSWQPMKYPLLSHVVHRKSQTLRFAKIERTSVIYVLLVISSYIYFLYFKFEEQTNKDVCILESALATYVVIGHIWMEMLGLERMFELLWVREP